MATWPGILLEAHYWARAEIHCLWKLSHLPLQSCGVPGGAVWPGSYKWWPHSTTCVQEYLIHLIVHVSRGFRSTHDQCCSLIASEWWIFVDIWTWNFNRLVADFLSRNPGCVTYWYARYHSKWATTCEYKLCYCAPHDIYVVTITS